MITVLGILMFIALIAIITSLPFQYDIVQALKKNGVNTSMFTFFPLEIRKYKKMLDVEENETIKKEMKHNYFGYIIPIIISLSCILLIISFVLLFVK
jgi:hypothetical protein